jgi:hypothetical protein
MPRPRIIPHAPVGIPDCGSFEVRQEGFESVCFRWDDNAGRRSISVTPKTDRKTALKGCASAGTVAATVKDGRPRKSLSNQPERDP